MRTVNRLNIYFLFVFLISFASTLNAQVPPQHQAAVNQVRRDHSMAHSRMMDRPYNYRNPNERANPKYHFTVLFKDGSSAEVSSKIYFDKQTNKYYLLKDKEPRKSDSTSPSRIYANQTRNISRLFTVDKIKVEGIATDSCWLFKVLSGKINAYSEYSDIVGIDATYIVAYKTETGSIEPLIPEKLEPLISINEKAHKFFKRKDYYSAIERFNKANGRAE